MINSMRSKSPHSWRAMIFAKECYDNSTSTSLFNERAQLYSNLTHCDGVPGVRKELPAALLAGVVRALCLPLVEERVTVQGCEGVREGRDRREESFPPTPLPGVGREKSAENTHGAWHT